MFVGGALRVGGLSGALVCAHLELRLRVYPRFVGFDGNLLPGASGSQLASLHVVSKLQVHVGSDQLAAGWVQHRVGDFDAALGISRHHVSA